MLRRVDASPFAAAFASILMPVLAAVAALFLGAGPLYAQSAPADEASPAQEALPAAVTLYLPNISVESAALCRLGVNGDIQGVETSALRLGWYVDYGATLDAVKPRGVHYMPMVRLVQTNNGPKPYRYSIFSNHAPTTEQQLLDVIAVNPGAEWFIGNEPDRRLLQDDIEPEVYAIAYHDLYALIKAQDPTAKIIAGSIVQATNIRLEYLDRVLAAYRSRYGAPMPVDIWALHNFILNEASCDYFNEYECWGAGIPPGIDAKEGLRVKISENDSFELFKQQILRFRQWLANNGYGGVPVYLSEYGVLMPNIFAPPDDFPTDRVNRFMTRTFDYVLNEAIDPKLGDPHDGYRLIQRLSWYSVKDEGYNGYLFEKVNGGLALSPMGRNFADYASTLSKQANFYPVRVVAQPLPVPTGGITTTATLRAVIANSGNNSGAQSAIVRFYNGDPTKGGVQIGADQTVSLAGCGANMQASVVWQDAPLGTHTIYVTVEPLPAGADSDARNNKLSLSFFVGSEWLFLPGIQS